MREIGIDEITGTSSYTTLWSAKMAMDYEKYSVEWRQGYDDYVNGLTDAQCPYEDEYRLEAWYEGWTWAQEEETLGFTV